MNLLKDNAIFAESMFIHHRFLLKYNVGNTNICTDSCLSLRSLVIRNQSISLNFSNTESFVNIKLIWFVSWSRSWIKVNFFVLLPKLIHLHFQLVQSFTEQ